MKRLGIFRRENGFTLVEVLIGVLLLGAIGLIFTSSLQFMGRDYETARLFNRASRLAGDEVENCRAMAARGEFAALSPDKAGVHKDYTILWQVRDLTFDSNGDLDLIETKDPGEARFKEITITVTHKVRKDVSVVRTVLVGRR